MVHKADITKAYEWDCTNSPPILQNIKYELALESAGWSFKNTKFNWLTSSSSKASYETLVYKMRLKHSSVALVSQYCKCTAFWQRGKKECSEEHHEPFSISWETYLNCLCASVCIIRPCCSQHLYISSHGESPVCDPDISSLYLWPAALMGCN